MNNYLTQQLSRENIIFSWCSFGALCKTTGQLLVIVIVITGLAACSGSLDADLREYVEEVKSRQKGRIPPLPEPQKFEIYAYNEAKLRDPFIPTQVIEAANNANSGLRPDASREKDVLEQYPLGSLKMMGSLEKSGQLWALLRAPDGTLHRTKKGRHMGQNNGEIIKITENELELKEIVPDGLGGWIERFSILTASE